MPAGPPPTTQHRAWRFDVLLGPREGVLEMSMSPEGSQRRTKRARNVLKRRPVRWRPPAACWRGVADVADVATWPTWPTWPT